MSLRAHDIMQRSPLTLQADLPVLAAQHLLVASQVGGAPVVDAGGRVVGVLSAGDLLRALDQVLDEDLDATGGEDGDELAGLTVADVASPDVAWAAADTPAHELAARMHREKLHRVVIGDGHTLEGLVTTFDLLVAIRP